MKSKQFLATFLSLTMLLSCLAVSGVTAAAEEVTWTAADVGSWATLTADSDILKEDNLLAGIHPTNGATTTQRIISGGNLAASTDGTLANKNDGETRTVFKGPNHGWTQFTYSLDGLYNLDTFVLAGSGEGSRMAPQHIRIYVGDTLSTLYTEANLVVKAEKFDITGQNRQFKADAAKRGCYVGFEVYCPRWPSDDLANPTDEPEAYDDEGNRIFATWHDYVRIGEIGAYGDEWADATVGSWTRITNDNDVLERDNLLTGIVPFSGTNINGALTITRGSWDVVADGELSVKSNYENTSMSIKAPWGGYRQLTFDAGKFYTFDEFVFGGSDEGAMYTPHLINIYVSKTLAALYTEASLVVKAEKFDVNGQHWKFKPESPARGCYVGYEIYCADGSLSETEEPNAYLNGTDISAKWHGQLRIGEIGAYGTEWADADGFSWSNLYADSAVLERDNLLNGVVPFNGTNTGGTYSPKRGTWDVATDGQLAVKSNYENTSMSVGAPWGGWRQLTYDMGKFYTFDQFVFGSSDEGSMYTPHLIHIYVSDTLGDLYEDANLVVKAEKFDVTNQHWAFKPDVATRGRYVGYEIYCADGSLSETEEPNAYLNGTDISAKWHGQLRIGEIGAYGTEWVAADGFSWNNLYADSAVLERDNLLNGVVPFNGINADSEYAPKRGTWDVATDGELAVKADSENTSMSVSAPWGNWRQLTFDMGKFYTFDEFVFGSSAEGSTYAPHLIHIYVSNTLADLYTETNLVVKAEKFDVANQQWTFKPDVAALGRYVGYKIYCADGSREGGEEAEPNAYLDGNKISAVWHGQLRIGEIGAYGTEVTTPITNLGGQVRDPEATDNYALRFGFSMDMQGVTYAEADPLTSGNYTRAIADDASITVNGVKLAVADFGVLVSLEEKASITIEDTINTTIQQVSAENLYAVDGNTVTFTAVVVNIPAEHSDTLLYACPYVELADGTVLYGNVISRSVATANGDALS